MVDLIRSKRKWKTGIVYMDDIIICSKDIEEHLHHVDEIVTKFGEYGFTLNLKKCRTCSDSVANLGRIINPGRLEMNQSQMMSLRDDKPHIKLSEIRFFWGFLQGLPSLDRKVYGYRTNLQQSITKMGARKLWNRGRITQIIHNIYGKDLFSACSSSTAT